MMEHAGPCICMVTSVLITFNFVYIYIYIYIYIHTYIHILFTVSKVSFSNAKVTGNDKLQNTQFEIYHDFDKTLVESTNDQRKVNVACFSNCIPSLFRI
jgi:hypothetical protein